MRGVRRIWILRKPYDCTPRGCANLTGANLTDADLWYAGLCNRVGNGREIVSAQLPRYNVAFTSTRLQIGCENHAIEDWRNFDDTRILEMDGRNALRWWKTWKPVVMSAVDAAFSGVTDNV